MDTQDSASTEQGAASTNPPRIHPTASIHPSAAVHPLARVGAGASIGERARIGAWASIGERARIGAWASIGEEARIGARASIGERASIGVRASISEWASIGEGASIGECASIGEGASIGEEARVERSGDNAALDGRGLFYWNAYRDNSGDVWLRYGCEIHKLADWTDALQAELCAKHDSAASADLARIVRTARAFYGLGS